MGERERGYRRVTMLTGGLAAVSIAGTLGVAVAAHAEHTAEQDTTVPTNPGAVVPGAVDDPQPASDGQETAPDQAPADPPAGDPAAADPDSVDPAPAAEFPPVTDGGGEPGQATSGGS